MASRARCTAPWAALRTMALLTPRAPHPLTQTLTPQP